MKVEPFLEFCTSDTKKFFADTRYQYASAWYNWDKDLPVNVEVICGEIAKCYGEYLTVKRWLLIPAQAHIETSLVAEFDIKIISFGKEKNLQLNIRHLVPTEIEVEDAS